MQFVHSIQHSLCKYVTVGVHGFISRLPGQNALCVCICVHNYLLDIPNQRTCMKRHTENFTAL